MKKPHAEVTASELIAFLKGKIADYKLPRAIEFHSSLPRTLAGKMEKRKLRHAQP
jgi:acyl-CoA synthetase (AMP-forming)/AMP-acid ligase II